MAVSATTLATAKLLNKSGVIAKANAYNDRIYLNLIGHDASCAGDRNIKAWVKGNVLTIEGDKGSRSNAISASLSALADAAVAAGAVRKGYSDTIEATYTF